MPSEYFEFQMLLLPYLCVPAAFTLLFALVLALFLLWMKEDSVLRYFAVLRAIPSCLASCLYYMPRMHVSSATGNTCFQNNPSTCSTSS